MHSLPLLFPLAALALCASSCTSASPAGDYSPFNEGTGRYRSAQDALVGTPAPALPGEAAPSWQSFGDRIVILNLIASWNADSLDCARRAEALAAARPVEIAVIHILGCGADAGQAAAYAGKHGLRAPVLADADGLLRTALGHDLYPDVYLIRAGKILAADIRQQDLERALTRPRVAW